MRILIIYRHYWPDTTPYGRMLKAIAERLAADGHDITVCSAQPSYNDLRLETRPTIEQHGGVRIVRLPLLWERKSVLLSRLLNAALYLGGSWLLGALGPQPDLIMTHSTPPALMGFTVRLLAKARRSQYLYHCQDLNPECLRLGGKIGSGVVYDLLMALEKAAQRDAAAVVVLSQDMARTVVDRGLAGDNILVQNNPILEPLDNDAPMPAALQKRDGTFRVLFAGNHGVFQGLEHVIEAAWLLRDEPAIELLLVGAGAAKQRLIAQAGELNGRTVRFHDYVSVGAIRQVMRQSDLGLVTLSPGMYRVAYPSKTMTLLAAGVPILAVVEPDSELARFVEREGVGAVCAPNDAAALAARIRQSYAARGDLPQQRRHIAEVAERHFGLEGHLDFWSALMRRLADAAAPPQPASRQ